MKRPADWRHAVEATIVPLAPKGGRTLLHGAQAATFALFLSLTSKEVLAQTSPLAVPQERPDQGERAPVRKPAPRPRAAQAKPTDWPRVPFRLSTVSVNGSSLPTKRLSAAYQPFIGRMIDKTAMVALTQALADIYASSDIALYSVQVPDQTLAGGNLKLVVLEGYVEGIEISGKVRARRRALLEGYARRLREDHPLRSTTLQRIAAQIRDIPGLSPDLAFAAGSRPGAVKLLVSGEDQSVQATLRLSNRGIALLGRTQTQADVYANALFTGGDQFHATFLLPTTPSRFQYLSASYSTPVDYDGTTVLANIGYLRTRPPLFNIDGETIRLEGHSLAFGGQASRGLLRTDAHTVTATFGLDGLDSHNGLLGFTLSHDRTRAARVAIAFGGQSARSQVSLSAIASLGLGILGARTTPGDARTAFRKINVKLNAAHVIGKDFLARLNGYVQIAGNNLPGAEQIALGGDEFGRGYEASTIAGDHGYALSSEFAWRPQSGLPTAFKGSELYLFGDGGAVDYRARYGYPAINSWLASMGGGVRLRFRDKMIVETELTHAINKSTLLNDNGSTNIILTIKKLI